MNEGHDSCERAYLQVRVGLKFIVNFPYLEHVTDERDDGFKRRYHLTRGRPARHVLYR